MMQKYQDALVLLESACRTVDELGDTLVAAHLALPIALLRDRLAHQDVEVVH